MYLINDQIFYSLENYLDMAAFDALSDQIRFALAKNYTHFDVASTSQENLEDQDTVSVRRLRKQSLEKYSGNLNLQEANVLAKLSNSVTLGTHLIVRGSDAYRNKHLNNHANISTFSDQFKFLFDWINLQNCFSEYGRVIFWINEANQRTAFHMDYKPKFKGLYKDPFIWLTGDPPKQLMVKDTATGEIHYSNARALIFDTSNYHASLAPPNYAAWSLRIDGKFTDEFIQKTNLTKYLNS